MSCTTGTLAAYLAETYDATGVVRFIRERWPKSLSSYVSQTKKQWMTLEVIHPSYAAQYTAALRNVDTAIARSKGTEKQTLLAARAKLEQFNSLNLAEKNTVQRRLRATQFSGHAMVDDLITSFAIFPEYINDLKSVRNGTHCSSESSDSFTGGKEHWEHTVQASELMSKCKATLKDDRANAFDVAAALGLLTGRRCIEVLKSAHFAPVNDHSVLFSGQAKKGDLIDRVAYEIPVLASPDLINTALARLRAAKDCSAMTNRDENLKYAISCNAAARRLLGKEHHFHSLRGIYAVIAHNACLPHKYSLNAFVAKVLGHTSLGTSLHYSAIHVEHLKKKHKFIWSAIA
jgi:integrase